MLSTDTADLWWKSAIVYCLDVETFLDSNGDGIGDLGGLAERIDYLNELGVTCLWLMPFYPSPDRDDGYDVTDFYGVDPRLGDLGRLVEVVRLAHDHGIRVIADLVVNHTSDRHPWFKESRRSTDSPLRDFYVWRSDRPEDTFDQVVFPDEEDSIWELDERTGEWYLHHFYRHQPDLNLSNPDVLAEVLRVVGYWLELGLDGFRVDGVAFLGVGAGDGVGPHPVLARIREMASRRQGSSVLLGEVNMPYDEQLEFFGSDRPQLHTMFDFPAMQATYLALARGTSKPLADVLGSRPELAREAQLVTFLRNHDELTLDQLTDSEREEIFAAFGPETDMQLFGRGLRRRVPGMLDGDPRRIRMAYSLMFSLPGTPCLYYGEEIGLAEDLTQPGRMAVRPPMQWADTTNAGFSTAPARRLVQPIVTGPYGPERVNVSDQMRDPASLWHWVRSLISLRRSCPEVGWGELSILADGQVLVHRLDLDHAAIIAVHNFASAPTTLDVPVTALRTGDAEVIDLLTNRPVEVDGSSIRLPVDGYGVHWFRLHPVGWPSIP